MFSKSNAIRLSAVAAALLLAGAAHNVRADLIQNGDFEAGNTGFTSGYIEDSSAGAGANAGGPSVQGAGYYGIVTDSQFWHPSFTDFHDHTSGSGNMMIVNGDTSADTVVWQEDGVAVTTGVTYELDFWAASAYPASPAVLHLTADVGGVDQTFDLTSDAGVWHKFSLTFVADNSPATIQIVDTDLEPSGNDFALDDISLNAVRPQQSSAVPLPSASLGGVALAGLLAGTKLKRRMFA